MMLLQVFPPNFIINEKDLDADAYCIYSYYGASSRFTCYHYRASRGTR